MVARLEIKDLHVSVEGKEILKGVDLTIGEGEIHALMGPNGSGKSTLANTIMGHPKYKIEKGEILFNGENILNLTPDKRAKLGLFLGFQYPLEISGVSLFNFLKTTSNSLKSNGEKMSAIQFQKLMKDKMSSLKMDESFMERYLNEGFSGGEKKKSEILQLMVLGPKIAILDETDSGTDVDALKDIADGINKVAEMQKTGILLITHYNRILQYIKPNFVHVLINGKILKSGGGELANTIDKKGYGGI
jgi:Fe-S cluster assembly ATP-binding protein